MRVAPLFVPVALLLAPAALAQSVASSSVQDAVKNGTVRVMIAFTVPVTRGATAPEPGSSQAAAAIQAKRHDIESSFAPGEFVLLRGYSHINAMAGEVNAAGLARLMANSAVLRVDLDEGGTGNLNQGLPLANIDLVKSLGLSGAGVTLAVIDTGYDSDHADLSDDLTGEACFCSGGGGCCPGGSSTQVGVGAAEDDHGHGTNVSGIITSAGNIAPEGGAPDADIVAVKVMDSSNSFCCSSDVVAGLDWIIANRPEVDVVNMSLGTAALFAGDCDNATAFTMAFATAINTLRSNGVAVFVSSGNNGSGTQMQAPACVASAISVGAVYDSNVGPVFALGCFDATTAADQVTCFTNSDSVTDLMAPGAPMTSSGIGGGTSTFYGTSQASPLAAACAALLLEDDPTLTPGQVEALLEASPVSVTDTTNSLSFPRVDCLAALGEQEPEPVPVLSPLGLSALGIAILLAAACVSRVGRGIRSDLSVPS
jgi:subtilisin family serine protease